MNVAMRREEIVHDDEVNLFPARKFDSMEAVKSRHERVGIVLDVLMIMFQYRKDILVLGVMDGLDDKTVIA